MWTAVQYLVPVALAVVVVAATGWGLFRKRRHARRS